MHDEFLHRLRKEPPPEFAAHLRAHLRRQSTSAPRARPPSLLRTLLTVLLLGGTAFAVTSVVMRGFPQSLLEFYHHVATRIAAERTAAPTPRVGHNEIHEGRWGRTGWIYPNGASPPGRLTHSATPAASRPLPVAATGAGARAAAGSSSPTAGAALGPLGTQIRVEASWAAYPYVEPIVEHINDDPNVLGKPIHIVMSVRDSAQLPIEMCDDVGRAPDIDYIFEPVGTVSRQPCLPSTDVVAIGAGYEAVVLARSPLYGELDFTRREIFLALAKWVPDAHGHIHPNPNTTWRQVNPALGQEPIQFIGPPLASPAGHSMIELLLEAGCKADPWMAALEASNPAQYTRICRTVRTDGIYNEVTWPESSRLLAEPNAVGIFGFGGPYSGLQVSTLDGVEPTLQGIESGAYPGSRELFLLVNLARIPRNVWSRMIVPQPPAASEFVFLSEPELQAAILGAGSP